MVFIAKKKWRMVSASSAGAEVPPSQEKKKGAPSTECPRSLSNIKCEPGEGMAPATDVLPNRVITSLARGPGVTGQLYAQEGEKKWLLLAKEWQGDDG